ncbi:DUF4062 domain-containing protein [Botrimarina mediterranea]|uniref:DUF4062 domain-containing protein n=1 Tax=Botrimarina mediterranea TaxID=2528022 RepID=A0A518K5Z3_9BACT|nr:DUF4062 domain-containing protein [Botrimarina mediterranea]QDV73216.1 hypothetical protein Spa11_14120 [Botrimarina mediterranea]
MRVFVSSVMQGFEAERAAARRAIELLRHDAVMAESFGAQPQSSQSSCLERVRSSDVFIGIFGRRYGQVAPSGMAVCEEEFEEARRRGLRILVYVSKEEKEANQVAFLKRVGDYNNGYFYGSYSTPAELQERVVQGLNDLERSDTGKKTGEEAMRQLQSHAGAMPASRHQTSLVFSITPTQKLSEVIGPKKLGEDDFHEQISQLLLFGNKPRFFDASLGTTIEEGRDYVQFLQKIDGRRGTFSSVCLYSDGSVVFGCDLTGPERGMEYAMMLSSVIDSDLTRVRLMAAIQSTAQYYQLLNDHRLATFFALAELRGVEQKQFGPWPSTPPKSMSMPTHQLGNAIYATDGPIKVSLPQTLEGVAIASDFVDRWTRIFKAAGAFFTP